MLESNVAVPPGFFTFIYHPLIADNPTQKYHHNVAMLCLIAFMAAFISLQGLHKLEQEVCLPEEEVSHSQTFHHREFID